MKLAQMLVSGVLAASALATARPILAAAPPEDAALRQAREFLGKHILIDGHNDLP